MNNHILESVIDVGSGFVLALLIQIIVFPWFGLHPSIWDNIGITIIFTVVSIIRSSLWRRYFRRNK